MEDFYGEDLDYIHLKFGRMQKAYNFTDKFRSEHPNFVAEYEKHWEGDDTCQFKTPMDIAMYVDIFNIPVRFYFNYTDTPAKDITEVYSYLVNESGVYKFSKDDKGEWSITGLDGEKPVDKDYLVIKNGV